MSEEESFDADALIMEAAREIDILGAEIKELTERRDALKSFFKGDPAFAEPGKYEYGDYIIQVSTNTRISEKKAKGFLGKDTLEMISVPKVDARRARAYLSPAVLANIVDEYDHKIEVKRKGNDE